MVDESKVEKVEKQEPKKESKAQKPHVLTPEQIESRQRAHEAKVAKFLAGGEF